MTPFSFGIYGERSRGYVVYIVTLYWGTKPVRSWARLTRRGADRKGAREVERAQKRWHW